MCISGSPLDGDMVIILLFSWKPFEGRGNDLDVRDWLRKKNTSPLQIFKVCIGRWRKRKVSPCQCFVSVALAHVLCPVLSRASRVLMNHSLSGILLSGRCADLNASAE